MGRDIVEAKAVPYDRVSIHAAAWAATNLFIFVCLSFDCFNPRGRMGRDKVSLRVLTDGFGFNPRGRMGRDFFWSRRALPGGGFQSTRPHGPRLREDASAVL